MAQVFNIGLLMVSLIAASSRLRAEEEQHPLRKSTFSKEGILSGMIILRSPSVQKELGLTDAQKIAIAALKEIERKFDRETPHDPREEEEYEKKKQNEVAAETNKKLQTILNPDQITRFLQIKTQLDGPMLVLVPDVAKLFKLTKDQEKAIESIRDDAGKSRDQAWTPIIEDTTRGTLEDRLKEAYLKQDDIFNVANEKISKLLTPKQLELLKKMKGKDADTATIRKELADAFGR